MSRCPLCGRRGECLGTITWRMKNGGSGRGACCPRCALKGWDSRLLGVRVGCRIASEKGTHSTNKIASTASMLHPPRSPSVAPIQSTTLILGHPPVRKQGHVRRHYLGSTPYAEAEKRGDGARSALSPLRGKITYVHDYEGILNEEGGAMGRVALGLT